LHHIIRTPELRARLFIQSGPGATDLARVMFIGTARASGLWTAFPSVSKGAMFVALEFLAH